ncbi:hypothetical protein C2845_PM08G12510 [Panicum miliaceum]|uniref:Serpin domain-containing protein n=1 Tax=Panicum miliaceum TaxID=4540 RepID=A0A3L6R3E6_PANMI|nr:hypothetical protein C2845_PM08G12510 [Panicum miliaceum]
MASRSSSSSFLRDHLPKRRVIVGEFLLPKFKLSFSSRMNRTLMAMGLEAVFSVSKADLSNILEEESASAPAFLRLPQLRRLRRRHR